MGVEAKFCECCGDPADGLFPITTHKEHDCDDDTECEAPTWCSQCWDRGDCKGPYGGCCYKFEDEEWWWRCYMCQRLAVPIPKEEPTEGNCVICEDCYAEEVV